MALRTLRSTAISVFVLGILLATTACRQKDTFDMSRDPAAWTAAKSDARQALNEVSLPVKDRYLTIHQESQWQNPFLTVESNMIQIRIYLADENSSAVDRGGLTRLSAARKHILNIRLKDLPKALVSLPDGAWPYGRVIAVREDEETHQNQSRLRSNLAVTLSALRDMNVVADDWTHRGPVR